MDEQRLDFVKELRPRFDVPDDAPTQSKCCNFNCNKLNKRQHMVGRSHIYCSPECMDEGHQQQYDARLGIGSKVYEIEQKLQVLNVMGSWHPTFDIHNYLTNVEPRNMYTFITPHDGVSSGIKKIKEYFIARENLIKLLIQEAFAIARDRTNTLVLDIALLQIKDMFHLDKFDRNYLREDGLSPKKEYLLSLLLFTGRYEEHYNVCCYYAQRGEQFDTEPDLASPFDVSIGFTDIQSNDIKSVIEADVEDITSSYFEEYDFHYRHSPRLSASHMFINKFTLHMNVDNLRVIRYTFLDNEDCIALIGEYIGLKKGWLKYEKNWYKDQAIEVLKEFTHSEELASQFGIIHGCSDIFLNSGHYEQIRMALKIGRGIINKLMKSQEKGESVHMSENWISDLSRRSTYNDRVDYLVGDEGYSDELIQKLNEIAGYTILGASHFSRHISATELFTEIYDICENNSPHSLQVLLDYMDEEINDYFSSDLLECLLVERKQIQAHFYHIHCFGDDGMNRINMKPKEEHTEWDKKVLLARGALNQIPSELSPYSYRRPLPLPDDDPFLNYLLRDFSNDYLGNAKKMQQVGGWLDDVTRVIDALFHRGLATNENLTAIFGNSSMVSYRLYELRKIKAEKSQTSITSFFSRKKARRV